MTHTFQHLTEIKSTDWYLTNVEVVLFANSDYIETLRYNLISGEAEYHRVEEIVNDDYEIIDEMIFSGSSLVSISTSLSKELLEKKQLTSKKT